MHASPSQVHTPLYQDGAADRAVAREQLAAVRRALPDAALACCPVVPQKLEAEVAGLEAVLPSSQEAAQKLTAELAKQEEVLEDMLEAIKGEVEGYHQQLSEVSRGGGWTLAGWRGKQWARGGEKDEGAAERGRLKLLRLLLLSPSP